MYLTVLCKIDVDTVGKRIVEYVVKTGHTKQSVLTGTRGCWGIKLSDYVAGYQVFIWK